ncbi:hypothetical protein RHMOL_Rhmol03G0137600 [Rhododendron molle]|uniref:Uncharacterized protein n=1 Tax=Rhododendron molle TaxID=49168 RepID=A0ACC0PED5_RHOML|nr:hypothetical protein RHMOL_Rhmol03G0137600 [Rhododendron molle]
MSLPCKCIFAGEWQNHFSFRFENTIWKWEWPFDYVDGDPSCLLTKGMIQPRKQGACFFCAPGSGAPFSRIGEALTTAYSNYSKNKSI